MYNSFACILFATIYLVYVTRVASENNVANTKQGRVKGIQQDVQISEGKTKTIYKFLGVPYAQKPIGNLRFKPPEVLSNQRSNDYDASFLRPVCMQTGYYFDSVKGAWPGFDPKKDMSEDCLYLNIYTSSTTSTRKYPVIVHIHGGSYFDGTPIRDISPGEYLPTRNVVLVTIQYRLGPFGFFTTGDSEAPGNVGLLDQVEALKWVRDNIEGFGGDKNSVTLLGESAGGSSVGLHYLSPLSKGLFHRGIAVSGVDFSPFAYKPKSTVLEASKSLMKKVNCVKKNTQESVRCLRSLPSATVNKKSDFWLMQPFVDQHFLPDKPKTLREEGRFHKLPLMSGFTSQECSFIVEQYVKNHTLPNLKTFMESYFKSDITGYTKDKAKDAFKAMVSNYGLDVDDANTLRQNLIDWLSDYYMMAPTHAALISQSDKGAPTYMFEFAHRSQHHPKPRWMGVVHEDTTPYKFGLPLLKSKTKLKFDENDQRVSDMVVTMFTNFAKSGNPTPSPVLGADWEAFDSTNKAFLKIQKNPILEKNYRPNRMKFWNTDFPPLLSKVSKKKASSNDDANIVGKPKISPLVW